MTKLKWGPVFSNYCEIPFPARKRKGRLTPEEKAQREQETKELHARSDQARYKAMVKKFGRSEALRLGVPPEFIAEHDRKKQRRLRKQ